MNKFIASTILAHCTVWSIVFGVVNAQTWAGAGATAGQPGLPGRNPDFSYGYGGVDSRGNFYGGAGGNGGYYVGRTDEHGRPYTYGSGVSPYAGGAGGAGGVYGGGGGGYGGGAGGYGGAYGTGSPFSGGSYPRGPYYNAAPALQRHTLAVLWALPILLVLNKIVTNFCLAK